MARYYRILIYFIILFMTFPLLGKSLDYNILKKNLESLKDYRMDNPEKAIGIIKEGLKLAQETDDNGIKARVLVSYADYLLRHDYIQIADKAIKEAQKCAPSGDTLLYADIMECKAFQQSVAGKDSLAMSSYKKALELYRRKKENERATVALLNIGVAAHRLQHTEEALKYYNQSLHELRERNDQYRQSTVLAYIARLTPSMQTKDSLLDNARSLAVKSNNSTALFQIYLYQARDAFEEGKYSLAFSLAEKSLTYQNAIPSDCTVRNKPFLLIAKIYAAQKEYSAAYEALQRYTEENERVLDRRVTLAHEMSETLNQETHENGRESNSIGLFAIIMCVIVLVLIIAILILIIKNRRIKSQNVILEEKAYNIEKNLVKASEERDETIRGLLRHTMGYLNYRSYLGRLAESLKEAAKSDKTKMAVTIKMEAQTISQFIASEHKLLAENDLEKAIEELKETINADYPELTPETLDMAVWLRLGFSTKDICKASGKKIETVQMTRYRLRKILNIASNVSLEEWIKLRWHILPTPLTYISL